MTKGWSGRWARAVVAGACTIVLAHAGTAAAADLYSRRAGFAQARLSADSPTAIRVWKPAAWAIGLNTAIGAWNRQAGRTLFERTRSQQDADVVLLDGESVGWATACYAGDGTYDMEAAYARCSIFVPFHGDTVSTTWTLIHELGHTLGFVDHVRADEYRRYVRWDLDPRVCDDPSHPAYSRYRGIMSDCPSTPRFEGDAAALVRAGYAAATT